MHHHKTIGSVTHGGSTIVSLAVANPQQLGVGSLVGINASGIVPFGSQHPAVGVLLQQGSQHVTLGLSGLFVVAGKAEVGQVLSGGRGIVLAAFEGNTPEGEPCDALHIQL